MQNFLHLTFFKHTSEEYALRFLSNSHLCVFIAEISIIYNLSFLYIFMHFSVVCSYWFHILLALSTNRAENSASFALSKNG